MFHHCPFWALAAAWHPEKNITYAFLHCTSDTERESIPRLKRFITKTTPQYMHPILLPIIIMDLETALTLNDDEAWTSEINDIEEETRQKPNSVPKTLNPHELDLSSIIQRMNGCSVFLSLIERESEAVLLHLEQARRMILELQSMSAALRQPTKGLLSHIDFLVNSRKNLFIRPQNLQRRSQTQLAFVCVQNNIRAQLLLDYGMANFLFTRHIIPSHYGITSSMLRLRRMTLDMIMCAKRITGSS
jgi:hypothetical protein